MSDNNKNKVFYGEYTLKHWVDLVLNGNIILPPYQRYFTWDEDRTNELVKSIKANQYVPPITIGAFEDDGGNSVNLIIDGQQRLTSILLAVVGYFPNRNRKKSNNDDENMIEWNFSSLLNKDRMSIDEVKMVIKQKEKLFKPLKNNQTSFIESELDQYYLGFNYLVPGGTSEVQQAYYSKLFRNINIQGKPLRPLESREALYYINPRYRNFFHPDFVNNCIANSSPMDFVRYLSFLSELKKKFDRMIYKQDICQEWFRDILENLAKNYSDTKRDRRSEIEKYYADYIYAVTSEADNEIFIKIEKIGDVDVRNNRINILREIILSEQKGNLVSPEQKINPIKFNSIVEMDIVFIGLIYYVLFEGKTIDGKFVHELIDKVNTDNNNWSEEIKKHRRNPNELKYIKERILISLQIYSELFPGDENDEQA